MISCDLFEAFILKSIIKSFDGSSRKWDVRAMDWIDRAQDRDRWRALANAVMNLSVPQNAVHFLTG